MLTKKDIAILKYMDLHILGIGEGLSKDDIEILNDIPEKEWNGIRKAIEELKGGSVK